VYTVPPSARVMQKLNFLKFGKNLEKNKTSLDRRKGRRLDNQERLLIKQIQADTIHQKLCPFHRI